MFPVSLLSEHAVDRPFASAYRQNPPPDGGFVELGFAGLLGERRPCLPVGAAVSAWLPGGDPARSAARLREWKAERRAFRFLFPERFCAPAIEAHRVFTHRHLGLQSHLLVKVRAHPDRLLAPERCGAAGSWLDEPVLNRLPLAVWLQGPVREVRHLRGNSAGPCQSSIVLLRHERTPRLSVMEIGVSEQVHHAGKPAVADRFECTGSDGFLEVCGVWQPDEAEARLRLHRGTAEVVRRDLPRGFAQVYERAARDSRRIRRRSGADYRHAEAYLHACVLVRAAAV